MKTFTQKNRFILSLIVLPFICGTANATTVSDYELKMKLESAYNAKIQKFHPDHHFTVNVTLAPLPKVELDLIGSHSISAGEETAIENRIQSLEVITEGELNSKEIAQLTGIADSKVKITKRAPETKASQSEVTKAEAKKAEPAVEAQSNFPFIQFGVYGLILTLGAFALFALRKAIRGLSDGFSSIAQTLKANHENQEFDRSKNEAPLQETAQVARDQTYSDLQLKAMFAECYWTGKDAEASALVRAFPKIEVYQTLRYGTNYIEYLKSVSPGSLTFTQDAYFITPNSAFFEMSVEDTPIEALVSASTFRFEKKNADPSELIAAQLKNGEFKLDLKLSILRKLAKPIRVQFKSVEEEETILKSTQVPEAIKLQLPSLYCLKFLNQEQFETVIGKYSLQELAKAWTGPAWLLTELEAKMTERKRALFSEIKEQKQNQKGSVKNQKVFLEMIAHAKQIQSNAQVDSNELQEGKRKAA